MISDGINSSHFSAGRGGSSLQLNSDASYALTPDVRLTSRMQYQKRLKKEGIDDWNVVSGLEISF